MTDIAMIAIGKFSVLWALGHGFFIIRFTDPPTVYFGVIEKKNSQYTVHTLFILADSRSKTFFVKKKIIFL